MFTRTKTTAERLAAAATAHATAADQAQATLYAVTGAADEIAHTAETMRDQGAVLVILAGVATLALLVTAVFVIKGASR